MATITTAMTDDRIAQEIGQRVAQLRLNANVTQQEVSEATGISRPRLVRLETEGVAKLITLIGVLRFFGRIDLLDGFIPEPQPSPLELAKLEGKRRQRASGRRRAEADDDTEGAEW